MRRGKRKLLDKARPVDELTDQLERLKASVRAKNTAQLHTLLALSNLWMVRGRLMRTQA